MAIELGNWMDAFIDISEDDDLTAEIDLGSCFEYAMLLIPTIDSAEIHFEVAEASGGTFYTLGNSVVIAESTGGFAAVCRLYGFRYIKVGTSAAQTADRTLRIRGYGACSGLRYPIE